MPFCAFRFAGVPARLPFWNFGGINAVSMNPYNFVNGGYYFLKKAAVIYGSSLRWLRKVLAYSGWFASVK